MYMFIKEKLKTEIRKNSVFCHSVVKEDAKIDHKQIYFD